MLQKLLYKLWVSGPHYQLQGVRLLLLLLELLLLRVVAKENAYQLKR